MGKNFIAEILKAKRKERNMSVKDVLEQLRTFEIDISEKTLYGWESGHRQPDADTFLLLCRIYGIDTISGIQKTPPLTKKEAPSDLSEEALKVAKDYSALDRHGKNMTKIVITEEQKRMVEEKQRRESGEEEPRYTRIIPLYYTPAAAGMTSPAAGQDFDYIEINKEAPKNADFAVKIDGDSMEPYIMDGTIVYVNREPLANGDVGIFFVDGDMLCKQYYKDERGNIRLLSLNRSRSDADRFISSNDSDTVMMYYGRVILPRRPAISWA